MAASVDQRLAELDSLLDSAKFRVGQMRSLNGARDPFNSLAENANLHDYLKRAMVEADKLSRYFGAQLKREAARK
jgi:hypothetical protein